MADYLVTIASTKAIGETLRVEAETPEEACDAAVSHGERTANHHPVSIIPWEIRVEALQSATYDYLDVPTRYASAGVVINTLREVLQQVFACDETAPLPSVIRNRVRQLLADE